GLAPSLSRAAALPAACQISLPRGDIFGEIGGRSADFDLLTCICLPDAGGLVATLHAKTTRIPVPDQTVLDPEDRSPSPSRSSASTVPRPGRLQECSANPPRASRARTRPPGPVDAPDNIIHSKPFNMKKGDRHDREEGRNDRGAFPGGSQGAPPGPRRG